MHSTTFTQVAQAADEFSAVVIAVVEDVRAMQDNADETHAAVILSHPDKGTYEFAILQVTRQGIMFGRIQHVGFNVSKAYKYLADYTLDRRPLRHIESGAQVEQAREAVNA